MISCPSHLDNLKIEIIIPGVVIVICELLVCDRCVCECALLIEIISKNNIYSNGFEKFQIHFTCVTFFSCCNLSSKDSLLC